MKLVWKKIVWSKKLVALIVALVGILASLFITDGEGSRIIIKLVVQMLQSVQGQPTGVPADI